jgi:sensor histidine kinase regulating citrate/malate metabolism
MLFVFVLIVLIVIWVAYVHQSFSDHAKCYDNDWRTIQAQLVAIENKIRNLETKEENKGEN